MIIVNRGINSSTNNGKDRNGRRSTSGKISFTSERSLSTSARNKNRENSQSSISAPNCSSRISEHTIHHLVLQSKSPNIGAVKLSTENSNPEVDAAGKFESGISTRESKGYHHRLRNCKSKIGGGSTLDKNSLRTVRAYHPLPCAPK